MRSQLIGIALLILILPGLALGGNQAPPPQKPNPPQAGVILLRRCTLDYKKTSPLGANSIGLLEECFVSLGDRVKAGQILGHLRDDDLRATLEVNATQAASDIAIRLAEAKHKLAVSQLERTQRLSRRDYASAEELNVRTQDEEVERISIEAARYDKRVAELQRRQTEAAIRMREIRSPHDGIVVEVTKVPGQVINPTGILLVDTVFRVVDPSQIRVTGYLDVTDAWRVRPGQAVKVWADISGADLDLEKEAFPGQIEFVDLQISPDDRTCKVTAIVPNRGERLRSGLEARMEINTGGPGVNLAKPSR